LGVLIFPRNEPWGANQKKLSLNFWGTAAINLDRLLELRIWDYEKGSSNCRFTLERYNSNQLLGRHCS